MTTVCRETFLENVVTTLTGYGYKTVHIDEDVLAIGNPYTNLYIYIIIHFNVLLN